MLGISQVSRKNYIDFTKGIAILAVVVGHLVGFGGPVFTWIFAFHMPAFFLVQGFMQKETLPPFIEFLKKKVVRLLVAGWIFRLVRHVIIPAAQGELVLTAKNCAAIIFWNPSKEWFLPVMFWVSIGMYVYILLRNKVNNDSIFAFISVFFIAAINLCSSVYMNVYGLHDNPYIPFKLDSAALAMSFSIIGYWIKKTAVLDFCVNSYQALSSKSARIAVLVGLLGSYTFLAFGNRIESYINMAENDIGNNVLAYYAAGTLMFLILMTIGLTIRKENIFVRWVYLFGRHSMMIYLGHGLINTAIIEAVKFLTDGQTVLVPMINLTYIWIAAFFVITVLVMTAICLTSEKLAASKTNK